MDYNETESTKGMSRGKERGEIGQAGSVETIQPFKFKGTIQELPMDYRGTTPKAFEYKY